MLWKLAALWIACGAVSFSADVAPAAAPPNFNQIVDGAVAHENALLATLRTTAPTVETYIQEMRDDADYGEYPKTDHYYLGKLDLSRGVSTASLIPKLPLATRTVAAFNVFHGVKFMPRGFAQTLLIDGADFDRAHYDFEYSGREFLGEVRAWVISVHPKKSAGHGRFIGSIWVEDRDFNIVRFNGTYSESPGLNQTYLHFDSWRVNCGKNIWAPYAVYSEEPALRVSSLLPVKARFKAITRVWGYDAVASNRADELTALTVDLPQVRDDSPQAADYSAAEGLRAWQRRSEESILQRMEKAAILSRRGDAERVLDTIVNNIVVTNNLQIEPPVHTRIMMTLPLEAFEVGHTIVLSRGLLDTLPSETALAAILAHEIAHVTQGHGSDTRFAFSDRVDFNDLQLFSRLHFQPTSAEEAAVSPIALSYLKASPYADKLPEAGLYFRALGAAAPVVPALTKPLFGARVAENHVVGLGTEDAPALQKSRPEQIAALPLGSRTRVDPWTDALVLTRTEAVPLLSAREKMPFEIAPIYLRLTYQSASEAAPAIHQGR